MPKELQLPLKLDEIVQLKAGDVVLLSGPMLTARDAAHKRLIDEQLSGLVLPIELSGETIYYVGPAPGKLDAVIGPAGPTTSGRMDPYTPSLLEWGVRGLIGKGVRNDVVKQGLIKHQAVYFAAVGGAAALLAQQITSADIIAYADLGTEAIRRLIVKDFPVIVVNDCHGGDAYADGRSRFSTAGSMS
ncbi:MAG: fumarate hydratase subunit beta [Cellvibrionaceae bacterium]|jgi:fumarate hydratase subunit beta